MKRKAFIWLGLMVCLVALTGMPAMAKEVTIVGEINDEFQLVTEDQVYDIAETALGKEMVAKHISSVVEVTGAVKTIDDAPVITVKSYKVKDE